MNHFEFYATPAVQESDYPGDPMASIDPYKASPQVSEAMIT